MALPRLDDAIANVKRRHRRALPELHPELRARVLGLLADLGGRFMCWEGYRGRAAQQAALARGTSAARFGQSPHNYQPALAVDVVLNPAVLRDLPAHPSEPDWPDLWHSEHPAWADLERAALRHHLERVTLPGGRRDLPHLQMPNWKALVKRPP